MTLATSILIQAPVNPELVFMQARRIIDIPAEQPFKINEPGLGYENGQWIGSEPGGFQSALDVSHANGELLANEYDSEWPEPAAYVVVRLDTTYGTGRDGGPTCTDIHNRVVRELGEWLDAQGANWWANNEFDGTWHERMEPYT